MITINKAHLSNIRGGAFSLSTFFCLYIAQTIPMSFFSTALQVTMRQAEYSLSAIALLQALKLPWILKLFWSPMVDRYCVTVNGYKRFIIISGGIYALLIFTAAMFDLESDFLLILLFIFLAFIASATNDIATDALAVLSFSKEKKSLVNSMQSMGSFGGTLIGSGVLLFFLHSYGWNIVVACLCLFVILATFPLIFNRQIKIQTKKISKRARFTDFIWFFTQRAIWKQVGFLILYYSGIIGILSILRPYLVDAGYSIKEIGMMSGVIGTATAFLTSFAGGIIMHRIGKHKSRIASAIFTLLMTLYFFVISWLHPSMLTLCIGVMLLWGSYGIATVVVYTSAMDCVRPGREGTDFTIQTVLTHLSGMLIAFLSGLTADSLGYRGLFTLELTLALITLIYTLYVFRTKKK